MLWLSTTSPLPSIVWLCPSWTWLPVVAYLLPIMTVLRFNYRKNAINLCKTRRKKTSCKNGRGCCHFRFWKSQTAVYMITLYSTAKRNAPVSQPSSISKYSQTTHKIDHNLWFVSYSYPLRTFSGLKSLYAKSGFRSYFGRYRRHSRFLP